MLLSYTLSEGVFRTVFRPQSTYTHNVLRVNSERWSEHTENRFASNSVVYCGRRVHIFDSVPIFFGNTKQFFVYTTNSSGTNAHSTFASAWATSENVSFRQKLYTVCIQPMQKQNDPVKKKAHADDYETEEDENTYGKWFCAILVPPGWYTTCLKLP